MVAPSWNNAISYKLQMESDMYFNHQLHLFRLNIQPQLRSRFLHCPVDR